ncbi:LOW QUALITY PROTEIN: hypothetical protein HID58_063488, partial [Brassica napus]
PQTGVPASVVTQPSSLSVLVVSEHSLCFLRLWDSLNFKKNREFVGITVLFLDEKVNSVIHGFTPVGRANHYRSSLKAGSFGFLRLWDSLNFKKNREFVGITVFFLDE